MEPFCPTELSSALEALAEPYTRHRTIAGPYVDVSPEEAIVHKTDLAGAYLERPSDAEMHRQIALKAISGTLQPSESASLIFNDEPLTPTVTEAALVYGALRRCVGMPKYVVGVFSHAEQTALIQSLAIVRGVDPGSVSFRAHDQEYTQTNKRQYGVAGHLWAMQHALLGVAGLPLRESPRQIAFPRLNINDLPNPW